MKRKPCGRRVVIDGVAGECVNERMPGKQRCQWHWLMAQSSDVQALHARQRLTKAPTPHRARVPKEEWPPGHRWCAGCQAFVPRFYCSGSRCKACSSMAAHERRVEKVYGIDGAEYDRILARQGGRCAICRNRPASIRLAVDHDHQTGEVRGLLCKRCNHDLLGAAHDDVPMLWQAIGYLLFPPAQRRGQDPTEEALRAALDERLRLAGLLAQPRPAEPAEPPF